MTPKVLASAIYVSLFALGMVITPTASAQSAGPLPGAPTEPPSQPTSQPKNVTTLSKVSVTGTLIKQSVIADAQPVLIIDQQQIAMSGATNVAELLQRMSVSGAALNRQSDYSTGNGSETIDLRYLGAGRTLVLINGHRLTPGSAGLGLQASLGGSADLSVIPTSIISHVEVLLDGASALYGSDAISGVVNIITKQNFNGAQVTADYGCYANYGCDGKDERLNFTMGHVWDRGELVVSISHNKESEVNSGNRDITRTFPHTGNLFLGTGFRGNYILYTPQGLQSLTLNNLGGSAHPTANDLHPVSDADLNDEGQLLPPYLAPQTVNNVYVQGTYRLNDHIQFNSNLIYSRRKSFDTAGYAYAYVIAGSIPSANSAPLIIPSGNPFNPFPYDLTASGAGGTAPGDVLELLRQDPNALDTYDYDATFFQYTGGFSGYFNVGEREFDWDATFTHGSDDEQVNLGGAFGADQLRNALGPASQCGSGTVNPSCAPYNLFGPNSQAASNYLFYTSPNTNSEAENIWDATISSSDIYDLPAGPLGFATGVQYRTIYGHTVIDPLRVQGLSVFASAQPFRGSFSVKSAFGELSIPLLQKLPGVQSLALDLQSRHEEYSTFGGNTSSRVMLKYNPVESLLLRATWSQGFRAPNLNDLFEGATESFPPIVDPCLTASFGNLSPVAQQRCLASGVPAGGAIQVAKPGFIAEGNPNLKPETSTSRTAGLVWSPDFVKGFDVNVDYYKIVLNGAITTLSPQDVLNGCYLGGNDNLCSEISRTGSAGLINEVTNSVQNIATLRTEGIDYGVGYRFPASRVGTFKLALHGTHIRVFDETTPSFNGTGGSSTQSFVGKEQGGITFPQGVPANKANLTLHWSRHNWGADYTAYFIEGIIGACSNTSTNGTTNLTALGLCNRPNKENPFLSRSRMPDVVYNDVSVSYTWLSPRTTVRLGVNNIFDRDPPVCYSCSFSFDPTLYRLPGRFVFARIDVAL